MSSSKFNPTYRTRRPPPQCKKSKPNPMAPPRTEPIGSLAGQNVLLSWSWRDAATVPVWTFGKTEYREVDTFNTIISRHEKAPGTYAEVVWTWFPTQNRWRVSCDVEIMFSLQATTANYFIPYNGLYPFSIPLTRIDTIPVAFPGPTFLYVTVTW